MRAPFSLAMKVAALYCDANAAVMENLMSGITEKGNPLRHFRMDRRAVLTSLATGVGAAAFASSAVAAHVHGAAATAPAEAAAPAAGDSALLFLDGHAFETLALLGEQIVPGSRAVGAPEFLDRLLAVESTETQKRFMQALGAFEGEARAAYATPWKALTAEQANTLLTKISGRPDADPSRAAFERIKGAVSETYYSTEVGLKELGWDGSVTFAPPNVCG
jgi:hypothetical protein